MIRTRKTALKTLESGTPEQIIDLLICELDKMFNVTIDGAIKPLLTEKEYTEAEKALDEESQKIMMERLDHGFFMVQDAVRAVERVRDCIKETKEAMDFWQHSWAMAEQLETSVNVALLQIDDQDRRAATAMGIANSLDILGFCQSVDPDGMLIISPHNPNKKRDAAKMIAEIAEELGSYASDYKTATEAIAIALKHYGLEMPATMEKLRMIQREVMRCDILGKYRDTPQMSEGEEPEAELLDSGKPLLFERYRIMPSFADIPANPEKRKTFLKDYFNITE